MKENYSSHYEAGEFFCILSETYQKKIEAVVWRARKKIRIVIPDEYEEDVSGCFTTN